MNKTNLHTDLTNEDIDILTRWQAMVSMDNVVVERPVVPVVDGVSGEDVGVVLGAAPRLSRTTQREYERRAREREKRVARVGRKVKRKRGHLHWKSKEATYRRNALKRWTEQPRKSLVYSRGVWDISEADWERCIAPLWKMYSPKDLRPYRHWGHGTKSKPYTVYTIDIRHSKLGTVYSGADQLVYDLSQPNELDIKKAPEGELLFTDYYLDVATLTKLRIIEQLKKQLFNVCPRNTTDSPRPPVRASQLTE